ncbi:Glycosyltransferase [Burkholderia ubonensis]|nr:glycosyltransferase [Burkholderia ubonensis]
MLRTIRQELPVEVCLVDNGGLPDFGASLDALRAYNIVCTTLTGHGNIGYGRGHNLAIEKSCSRYHLVLNPDIDIDPDALIEAFAFLDAHADVALLTPRIDDQQRRMQYLCRRYPTMVDLFVRGFFPENLRRLFARRLASYEMQDVVNDRDIVWDPPIVSGCFMLFRTRVLKQLGGFDPRYFLYFEDYDLSLRTNEIARVAYVPSVHVVHHGGGASRKGFAHIRMFGASAFKFFNRFGWRLW